MLAVGVELQCGLFCRGANAACDVRMILRRSVVYHFFHGDSPARLTSISFTGTVPRLSFRRIAC